MIPKIFAFACLSLLAPLSFVSAQEGPPRPAPPAPPTPPTPPTLPTHEALSLDPAVTWVVSGGRWTAAGQAGYYRLVVRTAGVEPPASELTIEWVSDPARDKAPEVVRSSEVTELRGGGVLERPQVGRYQNGWRVWVQHAGVPGTTGSSQMRAIDVGAPGVYRVSPTAPGR